MEDLKKNADKLRQEIALACEKLKIKEAGEQLEEIRAMIAGSDFWQDSGKAQEISKKEADLSRRTQPWLDLQKSAGELADLASMGDDSMKDELEQQLKHAKTKFDELKADLKFQGPYDDHDVVLSIYAGAGGTDAQDWAQMLSRMYLRWAEKQGLKSEIVDESAGEEAGIKSTTIKLTNGDFLYGKLAGEHGVHRLVRRSPFNSTGSRETSFAKVEIMPLIDKPDEVKIDEKDLKIDVFRSGGAGGQSVNTTDSAVRVTHTPTGVTVTIQNERSQLQNKETALNILRSKLIQLQLEQHTKDLADIKGPSQSNEFGSQIRNYILDDRILKDLRTGYENHDPQKVLDGDLDPLIDSWLNRIT